MIFKKYLKIFFLCYTIYYSYETLFITPSFRVFMYYFIKIFYIKIRAKRISQITYKKNLLKKNSNKHMCVIFLSRLKERTMSNLI